MGNRPTKKQKQTEWKPPVIPAGLIGQDVDVVAKKLEILNPGYRIVKMPNNVLCEMIFIMNHVHIYYDPSSRKITSQPEQG